MKLVTFEKYCNNYCYNPLFTSLCSRWQPNARASHNFFFFSWNSTVECYDPAKNEWKFVTSMNNQRDGACVVTEGRYIYVISGYDGHSYLSSVEMYDPSTDDWALGGKITSF